MQATTPIDFRVLDAMMPYITSKFGNPSSADHKFGTETMKAIEKAREQVASLAQTKPSNIIFTSGATESNNIAIKGIARSQNKQNKNHIITTQIEHKAVLNPCRDLEEEGFQVTFLKTQKNGIIDLNDLKKKLKKETFLISTAHVNNEIGVIQPLEQIGEICKQNGIIFHTDCAQSYGKIETNVTKNHIDLMSMSGHKIYGPKGVGALYINNKNPNLKLTPILSGGGQEKGLRSGTLSPLLIVGFGAAAAICEKEMKHDEAHVIKLTNYLKEYVKKNLTHIIINGDENQRYKGNLNISFEFVEGESLLFKMKDFALSSGSACTSASLEPSYVLQSIGVSEEASHTSIRIGFGRFTTKEEVEQLAKQFIKGVNELRELSPLWEMMKEGVDISKIQWQDH